jgi:hypothetical protein
MGCAKKPSFSRPPVPDIVPKKYKIPIPETIADPIRRALFFACSGLAKFERSTARAHMGMSQKP